MSNYKEYKAKANTILRLDFIAETASNYIATEARDPAGRMVQDMEKILKESGCPEASREEIEFILDKFAEYAGYNLQNAKQAIERKINGEED